MHRIFLIDDHPMMREGLAHLIQRSPEFEVCGEAGTAAEAFQIVPKIKPDLVVMDLSLPDKNGLELIKDLQALCPEVSVLVLSMHDEMLYAERVIRAGGRGYIMKESAPEKLADAMRKVLAGMVYVSDKASTHILDTLSGKSGNKTRSRLEGLTDREFEVFELVGEGKSAHEIAERLNISPRTVDAHRAHIREKLGLPDSAALMRYAVRWVEAGAGSNSLSKSNS